MKLKILKQSKEIISLSELYKMFSKDIFRYSFSILKNEEKAKDAVQEVFVKYAESESSFKRNCSLKTWLLVITRNYCYNKIKSKNSNNDRLDNYTTSKFYENDYDSEITIKDALMQLSI